MRTIAALILLPLLAAASAPVQPPAIPLDTQLQQARSEQLNFGFGEHRNEDDRTAQADL